MDRFSNRTKHRLLFHHLVLALISGTLISIIYLTVQSADEMFRWSLATGYVGIGLLGATLFIGSLNVLRRRRNPVSTDLRRDIGIWCGIISLTHVVIGLQVHMGGNMLLYFFRESGGLFNLVPRTDLFGFANYLGLIAVLILCLLLLLSNDASIRRLGKKRWKFYQRWNYALMFFVMLHSIAYQIIETRLIRYLILFGVIVAGTLLIQLLGLLRHKKHRELFH
ncbi:MAG: ferric reductase-like transmembrane domain-containing protein [Pyrinomonadaceae bacterium]